MSQKLLMRGAKPQKFNEKLLGQDTNDIIILGSATMNSCTGIGTFTAIAQSQQVGSFWTDDLRETFFKKGYVVVKGAFSAEVQELNAKADRLINELLSELIKYSPSERQQVTYVRGSQVVFKKDGLEARPSICRVVGCGSMEPYFLEITRSPKLLEVFFSMFNTNTLEQTICQLHPKLPGDTVEFARHQDIKNRKFFDDRWEDITGPCSCAVAILAIDPMNEENGGLFVEPESHREGVESNPIAVEMEPGDLLFVHPYLWHMSSPNTSEKSRRTLLAGYCAYGANHKNYPGDCTSYIINKQGAATPAPWYRAGDQSFFEDNKNFLVHKG